MRLYAAMLSGANETPQTDQLRGLGKAIAQMIRLTRALEDARELMQTELASEKPESYQALFMAPEYYFSNRRFQSNRFFKHEVKRWILAGLTTLARFYPEFLIIPGTLLWTKSARRGDASDATRMSHVEGRLDTARKYYQDLTPGLEKKYADTYKSQVPGIVDAQRKTTGYSHTGKYGRTPDAVTAKNDSALDMPKYYLQNEPDTLVAQNVAYVLKDDRVLKYHKVGNVTEVEKEQGNMIFEPGAVAGRFRVGAVEYGLEICMDHWLGVLKESGAGAVDIHLITSSTTENRPFQYAVKSGGLVLHASTGTNKIFPAATKSTPETAPKLVKTVKGKGGLTLWVLDLNDKALGLGKASPQDVLDTDQPQALESGLSSSLGPVKHLHPQYFDAPLFAEMVRTAPEY